jgi:predicted N-acyltransferase
MLTALAYHLPKALEEENFTMGKVYEAFKMQKPEEIVLEKTKSSELNKQTLTTEHFTSIQEVNKTEWNQLLGYRGSFDWDGLNLLEESFKNNIQPENNWTFDYFTVKDQAGKPVLSTFITSSINKDDMLAPAPISKQIEATRNAGDPYYLTSKVLMMGSMLTEGEHLFIDKSSLYWKEAMHLLFDKINELQEKYKATMISLRDLNGDDKEMDSFLLENGFIKTFMPENCTIKGMNWENRDQFLQTLSYKSRRHLKESVIRYENQYDISIVSNPNEEEIKHYYDLYLNVKRNNLLLNTFELPYKLFKNIASAKNWEIISLKLKDNQNDKAIAVVFSHIGNDVYNPMIMGLDYKYLHSHKCYKQALYRIVERSRQLNLKNINFGYAASTEKKKLGANINTPAVYIQARDNYSMQVIASMSYVEREKVTV